MDSQLNRGEERGGPFTHSAENERPSAATRNVPPQSAHQLKTPWKGESALSHSASWGSRLDVSQRFPVLLSDVWALWSTGLENSTLD